MNKIIIFDETGGLSIKGKFLKELSKKYHLPYVTNETDFLKCLNKKNDK